MPQQEMDLKIGGDGDVAYLTLPGHPGSGTPGVVAKTVDLSTILEYSGASIHLDLDSSGRLIGIEILT